MSGTAAGTAAGTGTAGPSRTVPTGPTRGSRGGVVASFDRKRGLGVVASDGDHLPFHLSAIADGTREVDPGTAVRFLVVPGHGGELEARDLVKLEEGGPEAFLEG